MKWEMYRVELHLSADEIRALRKLPGFRAVQKDAGYLAHAVLSQRFGRGMVQPFRIAGNGDGLDLEGYCASRPVPRPGSAGKETAEPLLFPEQGSRLSFALRACPVIRLASARVAGGQKRAKGAEVDVAEDAGASDWASREAAYSRWLQARLGSAAKLLECRMTDFALRRLMRREQRGGRAARIMTRPDALLEGILRVDDSDAFSDLLLRGVGRHKAFGFGMLAVEKTE
ncbi:MAG TPA: type I-E CRISPR-associated protein Cas6/Cse3/CasE [Acidobacteriota bacterium]|nr:type I-E CRISPR-associated protein Cas6/Cse3/CasE [Acidobacteriota bacterium]